MSGTIECLTCGRDLPGGMFYRNSGYRSGYRPICKQCLRDNHEETAAKQCSKCKVVKYAHQFRKDARSKDGLQGVCKACKAVKRPRIKGMRVCKSCGKQKESWLFYNDGDRSKYSRRNDFCLDCKIEKTPETPNVATCKSCLGKFPHNQVTDHLCRGCHSWYFTRHGQENYQLLLDHIRKTHA